MSAKIAVVNDDTAFLHLVGELLQDEGYGIALWFEGATAHQMIKREQPDLVVLDIRMGGAEAGMTVLELLRLDRDTRHIPVIVSSADHQLLASQEAHLKSKGCAILRKPFDIEELLDLVRGTLGGP